jgi:4-diphosphocytidyl-2-C-methyl-D-erythritol kinase
MRSCVLEARAKVNLYLEICGLRPDGFHAVRMILQSIGLADVIRLSPGSEGILIRCNHPQVPSDCTNLAYRAAELIQASFGISKGIAIEIEKRIPVEAGLAGGSTNAAAVLVGLNQVWGLGQTQGELAQLGQQLGSDIPFCIAGGTQLAQGRGEILEPLPDLDGIPLLLAKPRQVGISTAWAYRTFHDFEQEPDLIQSHDLPSLIQAIQRRDAAAMARLLSNDLERPVLAHHPLIAQLKQAQLEAGALGSLMSGSGSTVFGIWPTVAAAAAAQAQLAPDFAEVDFWVTTTAPTGITLHLQET